MKAISFGKVKKGDTIVMYDPSYSDPFIKIVVAKVDENDRSVVCVDTGLNFYPNEEDQYILIDY